MVGLLPKVTSSLLACTAFLMLMAHLGVISSINMASCFALSNSFRFGYPDVQSLYSVLLKALKDRAYYVLPNLLSPSNMRKS